MPANLPPQYVELEREYRDSKDPAERLSLLERMLREIPKHKGTSHLVGELKHKISKLKTEIEAPKAHGASRAAPLDHIPREGAGQFVLFGPPNSGKSSILGATSNAKVEVAEWPFSTHKPIPGMAMWENVRLQLIDTPPISREHVENYVFNIIRTCDAAVLVLSLGNDDLLDDMAFVANRVHKAKVRLSGLAEPDPKLPTAVEKFCMIAATGSDLPDADMRLEMLRDQVGGRVKVWPLSIPAGEGLKDFLHACFLSLGRIRVYTKAPGHDPDMSDPVLVPPGSTIGDVARAIHKDFIEKLQFAKVWGTKSFDGQRVTADHTVEDGDILEFHV
jgi:hypothetical protein